MKTFDTKKLTLGAMIAALYVVLTVISNALGLANMQIQLRLSEALTILPIFTSAAIPGLFIGCLIANIITGALLPDIILGSLATLLAALLTYHFRTRKFIPFVFPVLVNALIIPFVLYYAYGVGPIELSMLSIFLSEAVSAGVLGYFLKLALEKINFRSHLS